MARHGGGNPAPANLPGGKWISGWWWPEYDDHACRVVPVEVGTLPLYVEHAKARRVAVQAGANVGIYPMALARMFEQVYAFEPDAMNFDCALRNVTADNVRLRRAALSHGPHAVECYSPDGEADNSGALRVRPGGRVEAIALDSLKLEGVDLIMLDVEGWEYPALCGAWETIERCRPAIAVEMKGIGNRIGFCEESIAPMLSRYGYSEVERIGRDRVFAC